MEETGLMDRREAAEALADESVEGYGIELAELFEVRAFDPFHDHRLRTAFEEAHDMRMPDRHEPRRPTGLLDGYNGHRLPIPSTPHLPLRGAGEAFEEVVGHGSR